MTKLQQLLVVSVLTTLLVAMFHTPALAVECTHTFTPSGAEEVPPNGSTATGTAVVTYDTDALTLSWNISYSGIDSGVTGAHFHGDAPPGSNAGVQVNIGALSGGTDSPMIGNTTISQAQMDGLSAELWYLNIHSSDFPGGEIRGQVPGCAPTAINTLPTTVINSDSLGVLVLALLALSTVVFLWKRPTT